jgi:hypothetical protein
VPATIALGAGEHVVSHLDFPPPFDSVEVIMFPVQLTNTSGEPVWYRAQTAGHPWVREWVRSPNNPSWTEETFHLCALGVKLHELAPGESVSFEVATSTDNVGGQYRIELEIFAGPSPRDTACNVSSAELAIK